jgi:heme exporter protein B
MNTRAKDVMLAVLFIPLIYPLLYACVTATTAAITGNEFWMDYYIMPLVLACGYDVVMLLVCWVLYDFVVSA